MSTKKSILIGIMVVMLALGAVGAAFATSMDFSNIGILSSGKADVPQANTTRVGFLSTESGVQAVTVIFDSKLEAGTSIWVRVDYDQGDNGQIPAYVDGYLQISSDLSNEEEIAVPLKVILEPQFVNHVTKIPVSVAERQCKTGVTLRRQHA